MSLNLYLRNEESERGYYTISLCKHKAIYKKKHVPKPLYKKIKKAYPYTKTAILYPSASMSLNL